MLSDLYVYEDIKNGRLMQLSEDGQWMWNGTEWIPANQPPVPVAQPQPTVVHAPVQQATATISPQSTVFLPNMAAVEESKRKVVPWIGVGLIFFSVLMPYVSVFGFSVSGLDLLGLIGDAIEASSDLGGESGGGGGGEGGGDSGFDFGITMFVIAAAMLVLSPIVYVLSAIIACVLIGTKKSTKVLAILHFGYFGLFLIASVLGAVDLLGEDLSVLGFVGIGFYVGSLAPGLWFVDQ